MAKTTKKATRKTTKKVMKKATTNRGRSEQLKNKGFRPEATKKFKRKK